MRRIASLLFIILLAGCSASSQMATPTLTLEGAVSLRGNTPFTALMLETDQRNQYVLEMTEAQREALEQASPAYVRMTGTVYKDSWNGMPWAHLRVESWEEIRR